MFKALAQHREGFIGVAIVRYLYDKERAVVLLSNICTVSSMMPILSPFMGSELVNSIPFFISSLNGILSAMSLTGPFSIQWIGEAMISARLIAGPITPFPERVGSASLLLGCFRQMTGARVIIFGCLLRCWNFSANWLQLSYL